MGSKKSLTPVRAEVAPEGFERESTLLRQIHFALNNIDGVRVWRNQVGVSRTPGGAVVRTGMGVGSADLIGIAYGRPFAVEVKSKTGKTSKNQIAWLTAWGRLGGVWAVARTVEAAVAATELARLP